ncbi:hypothetical protein RDV89_18475 [Nocardioides zeae]|uniref:CsbD family protein n=1 Tax=Nocardioides imazamoxiresistens TaxID=3231893 RepID=A0ABU3Q207_9ACTN|nr:hypothetical protein [Nocardioides zeae]MDT9595080.1 hypothetical protein [Nocardioides zeae]
MGDARAGDDRLSRAEIAKDVVQSSVEIAATTVGRVAGIVSGAVRDVARAVGDGATEAFELRDAARRAALDERGDAGSRVVSGTPPEGDDGPVRP